MKYNGQSEQDKFVLKVLKRKRSGYFLEIGSNHPIQINNTYILENKYKWRGVMVEYDKSFLPLYKQYRPNSIHIMDDATNVDYKSIFTTNSLPLNLDYLQIDLEVTNRSTLTTLEKLDKEIFDKYKFATVTFEHDIYVGNCFDTRERSREIFQNRGYVCVLKDIHYEDPSIVYEDWYVHPELVDMNYVKQIKERNQKNYIPNRFTEKSIDYRQIEY